MSLNPAERANFDTLRTAMTNGDTALVECRDRETGERVPAVCVVNHHDNGDVELIPVAAMFTEDPIERLVPPLDIETL